VQRRHEQQASLPERDTVTYCMKDMINNSKITEIERKFKAI